MKLFQRFRPHRAPIAVEGRIVTFTGGMGAQMLSAAIYFDMQSRGEPVTADLSYFEQPLDVALVGRPGAVSHWDWQIDHFGIPRSAFVTETPTKRDRGRMIVDGLEKLELAMSALEKPDVQARFPVPATLNDVLGEAAREPFLCLHVRRGDYVNVTSHLLVPDAEFIASAKMFAGLVPRVVILSDSEVPAHFSAELGRHFDQVLLPPGLDAYATHRVMRAARILICSNSQFSLIAGMMNRGGTVLVPKHWFTGKERETERPVHERCSFQLLTSPPLR